MRSRENIKAIAIRLRNKLSLDGQERFDAKAVLEAMKSSFPDFDYQETSDNELPDADGRYDPPNHTIFFPARVYRRLDKSEGRLNFSVAHELGHYILNHQERRFRRADKWAYERATPRVQQEEREADHFAAYFLAPDHLCATCRTVEDFIGRFGFTRPAAEIRKEEYESDLRRARGQERPLTPKVIDLLDHLRSKGHPVTSLPPGRPAPNSATRARVQARQPPAPRLRPHYMNGVCTVCRRATIFPLGNKLRCDTCNMVFDQLQDGDIVD
jgi:hypothetical protein